MARFPAHPLFDSQLRRNPLKFLYETYAAKLGIALPYGEKLHNHNFNRFGFIHPCDRRTDGQI